MAASLAQRWRDVRDRVDAACREADREPSDVTILPVSKTFNARVIREAVALGLTRFGENRVQEVRAKQTELNDAGIDWVIIGPVQTNKARDVAHLAAEVESLDRLALAEALDRRLQQAGRALDVLVEVKTSPESAKHGLPPEELPAFLRQMRAFASLRIRGLMTMAVNSTDTQAVRACFRRLRELRDQAHDKGFELPRLSMGMSGDFPLAIAEGATEVRIGHAIFGERVKA